MSIICPTITSTSPAGYFKEMEVASKLSVRLHIDISDEAMTGVKSVSLEQAWWDERKIADVHLMVKKPEDYLPILISHKPSLVIIHAEADVDHKKFTQELTKHDIKVGLALLQDTSVDSVKDIIKFYDHALIFSGHFGHHGGTADLKLLSKVQELIELNVDLEISWDGGVSLENAKALADAGIQVLNTGGAIQNAHNPAAVFLKLQLAVS